MSKTIKISGSLSLPLEAITNTFAIFGIRGSGKSNIGAVMAEEIVKAGQPVCIIDPTGAWYGLKSSADGKGPGLSVYVFGGEHADIPLEPTAGEVLANFVVENRVPVVLDLKLMRKHEQINFVMTFAETLFHKNREPLMVFIDEAARFAPQIVKDRSPQAARCLGAVEDLATLGRNRGLGVTLMAQRPAPVSTTLRTQVENLICLRTVGKHDRKALDEWVEAKGTQAERDRMMKDLAELGDGVGYFWSPGWLRKFEKVHFNRRETFDSGATPKIGAKPIIPRVFAEVDKTKLSADIKATVERHKADDPKELRKRIAELERTAKIAPVQAQASAPEPTIIEKHVLKEGELERIESVVTMFQSVTSRLDEIISGAREASKPVADALKTLKGPTPQSRAKHDSMAQNQIPFKTSPRPIQPRQTQASTNGHLPGPEQRILDAIAWLESLGIESPEQTAVAFLAGYTTGGGGYNNPRGSLRTKGYIEYVPGDKLKLTELGASAAHFPETTLTNEELQRRVMDRLPGPEGKILQVLLREYPNVVSNAECAEQAGYTEGGGGYNNPRGRLRTLGLIEYVQGGLRARDILFPV